MRKLNELTTDELLDFIFILTPVMPMLGETELVQSQIIGNYNNIISSAFLNIAEEKKKKNPGAEVIAHNENLIKKERADMYVRDVSKIVSVLTDKQNRNIAYELIALLSGDTVETVKSYPGPKFVHCIKQIITDTDFGGFFTYAEPAEPTESSSTPQNSEEG